MDSTADEPGVGQDPSLLTEAHALTTLQLLAALAERSVDVAALQHEPNTIKAKAMALHLYQKHVTPQPKRAPRVRRRRRASRKRAGYGREGVGGEVPL